MAGETDEKKKLATFVKSVHKDLRRKFKAGELRTIKSLV